MISNHSSERVVYKQELLIKISRSQMIPRLRPQIPHKLRRKCCGFRSGEKWRERKRRLKPAFPSFKMGNVRSLAKKMD